MQKSLKINDIQPLNNTFLQTRTWQRNTLSFQFELFGFYYSIAHDNNLNKIEKLFF